jgi:branched-chain amino acid transport system substrate-binding protein
MKKQAVGLVIASTVVLAACSSGSHSGSSGASKDTSPIQLYQIGVIQATGVSLPELQTSAEAAVKDINAHGGIHGRLLQLTTCNEAGDPNTSMRCGQSAVEDSNVVATIGGLSQFGPQLDPILEAGKLPDIGPDMVSPSDAISPMVFPLDAGVPGYAGMPGVAKKYLKATKLGVLEAASPLNAGFDSFFATGAKASGTSIVKTIVVPDDAIDYTQFIQQLESAGAQAIISAMTPADNLTMWKALSSTHSSLKVVMSAGSVSQTIVTQAGAVTDGDYVVDGIPAVDNSNAAGQAYLASMKQYEPQETALDGVGMRAWLSVELFADVARTIKGPITRASVLGALNNLSGFRFYWVNSLSYNKPGPLAGYPRVVTPITFPTVIAKGVYQPLPSFDPFSG